MVYNSQPVNIEFLILIKGLVFLTLYSFCSVKHVWYHGLALSFTVVIEMNFQYSTVGLWSSQTHESFLTHMARCSFARWKGNTFSGIFWSLWCPLISFVASTIEKFSWQDCAIVIVIICCNYYYQLNTNFDFIYWSIWLFVQMLFAKMWWSCKTNRIS